MRCITTVPRLSGLLLAAWFGAATPPQALTDPQDAALAARLIDQIQRHGGVSARLDLARIYLRNDRPVPAIEQLGSALSADPRNPDAHLLMAVALQRGPQPDLPKALSHCRRAVEARPGYADAHLQLGIVLASLGHPVEAEREFNRVLDTSADAMLRLSAHLGLVDIFAARGEREKADSHYAAARLIEPRLPERSVLDAAGASPPKPVLVYDLESHPDLEKRIENARKRITRQRNDKKQ